ncbi:MAG: carboxypeptidase-like regulatory domain-containing protein, partial [Chitinophagaceae bacterium]
MKTAPFYIILFLLLAALPAAAQYRVQGTVLDSSRTYPLEAVSVLSTSGRGTITAADGRYTIDASDKDSLWFSYLGKPTQKFPVAKIQNLSQFDIALQVSIPVLAEIRLRPRNYRQDSLQNR